MNFSDATSAWHIKYVRRENIIKFRCDQVKLDIFFFVNHMKIFTGIWS